MEKFLIGSGSSPHTRGAQVVVAVCLIVLRIIPAYAGSTGTPVGVSHVVGDHPRIRGEHFSIEKQRKKICGSSPHTRGALNYLTAYGIHCRIIPAYAGSTLRLATFGTPAWDHPRIRGEHENFCY